MNQIEKWPAVFFVVILLATAFAINTQFNPWMNGQLEGFSNLELEPKWSGEISVPTNGDWSSQLMKFKYWQGIYFTQVSGSAEVFEVRDPSKPTEIYILTPGKHGPEFRHGMEAFQFRVTSNVMSSPIRFRYRITD